MPVRGVGDAAPYGMAKAGRCLGNDILPLGFGGVRSPRPTGLANIVLDLCPQTQKCRSRRLHLLRHFI